MDRVKASGSVAFAARDLAPGSGTSRYFTSGDPGITAATVLPGYWLNMSMDELMNILAAAGITADDTKWSQVWQSILKCDYVGDIGTLNTYVANPGATVDILRDGMRIAIKPLLTNTGASTLSYAGFGPHPIVNSDGSALVPLQLRIGSIYDLRYDLANTRWLLTSVSGGTPRQRLTANLNLFVSATGNDTNDGLSAPTAFATWQHAASLIQNYYDLNGYTVTVIGAAGTYSAGAIMNGAVPGQAGPSSIKFDASGGTVTINASGIAFGGNQGAMFALTGNLFVLNATLSGGAGRGISSGGGSRIEIDGIMTHGTCATAHVHAEAGGLVDYNNVEAINGPTGDHWRAHAGGIIRANSVVSNLSGTPNFTGAYANADECGIIEAVGFSFTGSATGVRASATTNGVITTGGGGASFFPGNSANTTGSGGQIV